MKKHKLFLIKINAQIIDRKQNILTLQKAILAYRELKKEVSRIKGTRWVSVTKTKFEIDKLYIIALYQGLYHGLKKLQTPVLARWTDNGWCYIFGEINNNGAVDDTIKVWR